jgi:hypothetical protein
MLAERGRGGGRFFTLRVSADRGNLTKTVLRYTMSQQSCKDHACGWLHYGSSLNVTPAREPDSRLKQTGWGRGAAPSPLRPHQVQDHLPSVRPLPVFPEINTLPGA